MTSNRLILFVGNMNNNFFAWARHLRDVGLQVRVLTLPNEPKHFRAECDTFSEEDLSIVETVNWGEPFYIDKFEKSEIIATLGKYDLLVASGSAVAFLAKAGVAIDLFVPYGSDLYELPYFKLINNAGRWMHPKCWLPFFKFARYQQRGIRNALNIAISDTSPLFLRHLMRIKSTVKLHNFGIPMVYFKPADVNDFYLSRHFTFYQEIRKNSDFLIFHHSRHSWKNESDQVALKDNHKLLHALNKLVRDYPNSRINLITLEYGADVEASKELIKELNLTNNVHWLPLSQRKDILFGISIADLVVGELRNSWFTYGVVYEAMICGKPVLHKREDELYPGFNLYPMLHANSDVQIRENLEFALQSPLKCAELGSRAKEWYFREVVTRAEEEILKLLQVAENRMNG